MSIEARASTAESGATSWLALACLVGLLLPFDPASRLAHPGIEAGGYLQSLPGHGYLLIKAILPWVPLGLLAQIGLPQRLRGWLAPAAGLMLLASLPWLRDPGFGDLLEALYALPGVVLGQWLGGHVLAAPPGKQRTRPRPARRRPEEAELTPVATEAAPGEVAETAPMPRRQSNRQRQEDAAPRATAGAMLLGMVALALAVIGLSTFPVAMAPLGLGLALYAALLWFHPSAWLIAVPAALPLLDLAPWSGRFFLDEFDFLLLTTAGVLFLKPPERPADRIQPAAIWLFLAIATLAAIGSLPGLLSLPPLDANAFSSYWSDYNSLRVGKGFMWGGLLFLLIRRNGGELDRAGNLLALGMGLGLLGVGLVGIWERWLFAGLADTGKAYRIFATFSSMHTGGSHIEAYLVTALPFLWLGMKRLGTALLAAPVMLLAVYATIFTVARGGVLALGVVFLILAAASILQASHSGRRRRALLPIAVLAGLGLVLALGVAGSYFQQRFARTGEDWQIRMNHWSRAIAMMDASPSAQLFGMGLGSFPRVYLERGPAEQQSATYGFSADAGNTFLRLGGGDTLYYAQRVAATAGQSYHLSVDIRSLQDGKLAVPLCEKQMLDSRNCTWSEFDVVGDGRWHRYSRDLADVKVGAGSPVQHPPVELFLYRPGHGALIDVDNLHLADASGQELLCNGDFSAGGDCWFFKTHSHLPWHIKNVWVHALFEQGWLGLALFTSLVLLALYRLLRAAWRGQRLAWVLLASLGGLMTVGLFDSLLDAPRLATLLWAFLLLGGALPWPAGARQPRLQRE